MDKIHHSTSNVGGDKFPRLESDPSANASDDLPILFNRSELTRIATTLSQGHDFGGGINVNNTNYAPEQDAPPVEKPLPPYPSPPSSQSPDTTTQKDHSLSAIDPSSPSFDLHKWLKLIMQEVRKERDSDNNDGEENVIKRRSTGVSFRNLSVCGSGSALNLQDTVLSVLLAPFEKVRSMGRIFGFSGDKAQTGEKVRKKKILHDFDGVVESGEMLLVLGRPGAGCSTFLKTIAGKGIASNGGWHSGNLEVEEGSKINYNGTLRISSSFP